MKDRLLGMLFAAYLMPALFGGAAICARYDPPIWIGVPAVLVACFAWALVVVRRLPPFRGKDLF